MFPSSSMRPACSVMAVAVPIVSKKSVNMKLKIVSAAATNPSWVKTLPRSNAPSVSKFGDTEKSSGMAATSQSRATIVVARMLMISEPGTFLA